MAKEVYPVGLHRCHSCIQWDGLRSLDHQKGKITVDASSVGTCRVSRQKTKGTACCQSFFALL